MGLPWNPKAAVWEDVLWCRLQFNLIICTNSLIPVSLVNARKSQQFFTRSPFHLDCPFGGSAIPMRGAGKRQELGLDVPVACRWAAVLAQPKRRGPGWLGVWVLHPVFKLSRLQRCSDQLIKAATFRWKNTYFMQCVQL